MTEGWTPREFQVVRHGYAQQQVDETFSQLVRDLTVLRTERDALRRGCAELESRVRQLATETHDIPTYRGLGDRVERMLQLAEEEAAAVRQATSEEAAREREAAQRDASSVRADADSYVTETRTRTETEVRHLLERAQREADALRESSERYSRARRAEVDNLFEHNRAKAAEAATDLEVMLAQRRDQAERDFTARMSAAQAQLEAVERRAEALDSEAGEIRAQADRRAAEVLNAASTTARDRVQEANARAERTRLESQRELAAMMQRRDSINLQLTNVRQMLATLTGSAAAIDPLAAADIAPAANGAGDRRRDRDAGGGAADRGTGAHHSTPSSQSAPPGPTRPPAPPAPSGNSDQPERIDPSEHTASDDRTRSDLDMAPDTMPSDTNPPDTNPADRIRSDTMPPDDMPSDRSTRPDDERTMTEHATVPMRAPVRGGADRDHDASSAPSSGSASASRP